jgi:N-dimethylarginine dimethylaminohydrolase
MIAPHAWDSYGRKVVEALVPEPLFLEVEEMLGFCANSVVIGSTVVMAQCPTRVGRVLESLGFDVAIVEVSEFLKAGGGCRCLTLALDVAIPATDEPPPSTGTSAAR